MTYWLAVVTVVNTDISEPEVTIFVITESYCLWSCRPLPPLRTQYRVIVENLSTRVSWQVIVYSVL